MTAFSAASRIAAVAAVLLLAVAALASAATDGQTCAASTENPLANLNYTDPNVQQCVRVRCIASTGLAPTTFANGYCNGNAAAESAVACLRLYRAYNEYYSCVMRALAGSTGAGPDALVAQVNVFMNTPGYPYHLSPLGCYACNHFRETVHAAIGTTCNNWTCDAVSSQSAAASWYGQPGKGYNHQLCGTGCIAVMMLTIPFAIVSASMIIACSCCWPSPSLKTTYAEVMKEEEEEKHRVRSDDEEEEEDEEDSDADRANREPVEGDNTNGPHEPVVADNNVNHPDEEEEAHPDEYVNLR
ncbi:hypothetical protein ABB37_08079 [Leptomonas pyrrhocoris]|uniref:Membrane-associated protein n=1 Tax=Leptomonas pyrrhocoris TaxID=157538 RepID=A0A0M9FTR9_LEPPY|nr:hypothetical protein ABB37_08079 [Leptomonas pyrrhocoris]XP_015654345.1 hypothetical protein ABB37_08079 [Leptomonas pyrrhocoris]XP_015654346.1 hypothetical protein ABB37_08079 [Leptomonas pyrrhocoris]KPA75905.1 hypothetical protein ABB37_08079 [Leptomonas pyrrhocoris]KPA75906.1 hypothetical protein ABB37_08079 [Leptomonas pyrrhocoris]KPA75907.1 hypothetical protein ABB37_08079 [Leptomonas pyrrhocoris]|eukprot:XP_015654344.1 hypothetical protein ABB37_08079 [Leptomonas pyrrhocoris]